MVIISLKETSTSYRYKRLEKNTDPFYTHPDTFPYKQRPLKTENTSLFSLILNIMYELNLPMHINYLP